MLELHLTNVAQNKLITLKNILKTTKKVSGTFWQTLLQHSEYILLMLVLHLTNVAENKEITLKKKRLRTLQWRFVKHYWNSEKAFLQHIINVGVIFK